jgi:hypothetical protein
VAGVFKKTCLDERAKTNECRRKPADVGLTAVEVSGFGVYGVLKLFPFAGITHLTSPHFELLVGFIEYGESSTPALAGSQPYKA